MPFWQSRWHADDRWQQEALHKEEFAEHYYGETCKLTSNYDDTIDLLCASYRLAKGTVSRDWMGLQVEMLAQSLRITEKEPVLVLKIIAGFMDRSLFYI